MIHPSIASAAAGPGGVPPRRSRRRAPRVVSAFLALAVAGCATGGGVQVVGTVPDPDALVRRLQEATRPEGSRQIFFRWRIAEEGVRLDGDGVTRVEAPYRARLDLFLDNGEAAGRTILVDDDLALPVSLPGGILPPPDMLWGSLGVFRLGEGTEVLGGDELAGGGVRLRARLASGDRVHYLVRDDRVLQVEQLEGETVVKRVVMRYDDGAVPLEAVYRDLAAFRELTLTRVSVEHVDAFPSSIWRR